MPITIGQRLKAAREEQRLTLEKVFESSRVRNLELTPKDLPGYRDGSSPFISGESSAVPPGPAGRMTSEARK